MGHAHLVRPTSSAHSTVFVAPSLRCNLACAHCVTAGSTKGPEMTFGEFERVARWTAGQKKPCEFCLVGGEPTLWSEIDHGIGLLRDLQGIESVVFTNGARLMRTLPDSICFSVNPTERAAEVVRRRALENLAAYHESAGAATDVSLRYVVTANSDVASIENLCGLLEKFPRLGVGVGFDFRFFADASVHSVEQRLRVGRVATRLIDALLRLRPGEVDVQDVFPLCLFEGGDLARLRASVSIAGTCGAPSNSMLFLPGGAVQACPGVDACRTLNPEDTLSSLGDDFAPAFATRRRERFAFCSGCDYAERGDCQAGCLSCRGSVTCSSATGAR